AGAPRPRRRTRWRGSVPASAPSAPRSGPRMTSSGGRPGYRPGAPPGASNRLPGRRPRKPGRATSWVRDDWSRASRWTTYHAPPTASHPAGTGRLRPGAHRCIRIAATALLGMLVGGCTQWTGSLPVASFDTAAGGKMLRPDARASACRTRVLGVTLGAGDSPLDEAIHALLALDPEADTLTDVRIDSWATTAGLFD